MKNKQKELSLSEKDQEIIAVGASVASGCLPCTKFHVRAASRAGANEVEILQAVREATRIRMAATVIMAKAGGLADAEVNQSIPATVEASSLIRELVCISAAYAINCATSLKEHMEAARSLGASDQQMFRAMEIGCGIKDVAGQKAKTVAGEFLGADEEQAAACCGAEDDGASEGGASSCEPEKQGVAGDGTCSCQPKNKGRSAKTSPNQKEE
jgi:AhpD family alkylhydroperoxidase